jgi:hypothetical protein
MLSSPVPPALTDANNNVAEPKQPKPKPNLIPGLNQAYDAAQAPNMLHMPSAPTPNGKCMWPHMALQ